MEGEQIILSAEEIALAQTATYGDMPQMQPITEEFNDEFFKAQSLDKEAFNKSIKALGFENPSDLKKALAESKTALAELEKYKGTPTPTAPQFANEEVAHLNQMYQDGASEDEIANFLKVQQIQVDKMPNIEAVRMQIKMQYPEMDSEMVDAQIEDTYGTSTESEMTALKKGQLIKDAKAAKEFLAKQKKDAKKTNNTKQQQQAQFATLHKKWFAFNTTFLGGQKEFLIQLHFPKQDKPFSTVRIPLGDKEKAELAAQMTNFAVSSNLGFDKNGVGQLMGFYQAAMRFIFYPQIEAQIIAHTSDEKLRQVHNIQSPTKTQENIQLTTDEEEKKKAEGHAFFNR